MITIDRAQPKYQPIERAFLKTDASGAKILARHNHSGEVVVFVAESHFGSGELVAGSQFFRVEDLREAAAFFVQLADELEKE